MVLSTIRKWSRYCGFCAYEGVLFFFGLELSICYHDWSVAEGDHVLIQTPLFRVVLVFTSLHLHLRSTEVCFKSNFIHHSSKNKQEHKTIARDEPLEK